MKKYTFYFICFLMAVAVTSCKKEKEEDLFLKGQMTDFHGQKAYIDGSNYSCFRQGETIFVNGRNNCTVSALSNSDRTCTISGAEEANGYYAFYPANMISATDISSGFRGATVTLPRVQQYVEESGHQVIDNPMAGHLTSPSGTIQFYNLCALLKVNVTSNWTLDSIQVTMKGTDLWGSGSVDATNWKIDMNNGASHNTKYETVSLVFQSGMSTGNGKSVYIMVPNNTITADNEAVKVHFYGKYYQTAIHKNYSMDVANAKPVNYNTIITLANFSLLEAGIGAFTVNSSGKKVTFAHGNLMKGKTAASGYNNKYVFQGQGYHGMDQTQTNFNIYYNYSNSLIGDYINSDWGWVHEIITQEDCGTTPPHTWRIPTRSEWIYILMGRNGYRCVKAIVDNHNGLILFPDGWVKKNNEGHNKINTNNINNLNASFSANEYITGTVWDTYFNNEGCVFLRAFGCSTSTNDNTGYYAMADSKPTGGNWSCLYFDSGGLSCDFGIGSKGVNVRLVHDLPQY